MKVKRNIALGGGTLRSIQNLAITKADSTYSKNVI
jgi:hypothetical protein